MNIKCEKCGVRFIRGYGESVIEPPILADRLDFALRASFASPPHVPTQTGVSTLEQLAQITGVTLTKQAENAAWRYELGSELGRGGMGIVFQAHDHDLNREVAIKVLRTEYEISPTAVRRFVQEAQVSGRLQHPGIVPVYELGTYADGRIYLVMKLVTGRTLAAWLSKRTHQPDEIPQLLSVFQSVVDTMAYAHSQDVIHLDLKPSNIMISPYRDVHVMDWGIAKIVGVRSGNAEAIPAVTPGSPELLADYTNSRAGTILGTPGYMSPEQTERGSGRIDKRSDVYSLGVILFELLTEQHFQDRNPLRDDAIETAAEAWERVQRLLLNGAIDESLRTLVLRCVDPEPDRRPADASVVAAELAAYQLGIRERLTEAEVNLRTAEHRIHEERRRRRLWIGLLAMTCVAVAGISALLALRQLDKVAHRAEQTRMETEAEYEVTRVLDGVDQLLLTGRREKAEASVRLAEGLSKSAPIAVQMRVSERLADLRLLEQLDSIHLKRVAGSRMEIPFSTYQADRTGLQYDRAAPLYYARAFREYGVDVETLTVDQVVERLRSRAIRSSLIRSLDEWAYNTTSVAMQTRLRTIASQLETQPDRLSNRIRQAVVSADRTALPALLKGINPAEPPEVRFVAARALRKQGALNDAVQLLQDAVKRYPSDFWLNLEFGTVQSLLTPKDPNLARTWINTAYALSDGNADVFIYVAIAQVEAGQVREAEATLREALQRNPNIPGARLRLAFSLNLQRKFAEVREVIDSAIAAEPTNPIVHFERGVVLQANPNTTKEAIEAYRRAIELKPDFAEAYNNLGNTYTTLMQYAAAEEAFQKALEIRPQYARALFNQGVLYDQQGRIPDAVATYEKVIAIEPELIEAAYNLAHDQTYQLGKFADAIVTLETSLPHIAMSDTVRARWHRLITECRRLQKLEQRQAELDQAKSSPATAQEAADLAVLLAMTHRRQFTLATQYWEKAFQLKPAMADDLVQGYRYFAAGCALRATSDAARDTEPLTDARKTQLRTLAFQWLQADLALRQKQLQSNDPKARTDVQNALRFWKTDPNLSPVREQNQLEKRPEAERKQWQALWSTVTEMQKR